MQSQIILNGTTYGSDKIIEATYTHMVNNGEQLNIGVIASAQLIVKTRETWANGSQLEYQNRPHNQGNYTSKGLFVIKDVAKQKDVYTYTCYDYLCKLDTIIDTWWNGLSWPRTLGQLFSGVATTCGLSADPYFDAADASVNKPSFSAVNLRGRQIIQWIAQISGGYAYAKIDGTMHIKHYGTTSVQTFTNNLYTKLDTKNYVVPQPDWIQVGKNNSGDVWNFTVAGGVGGTGTNLVKIVGNPFCWGDNYTQSAANYCFNIIIHGWIPSYTPFTMHCLADYGVNAGDKITIGTTPTIVMTKKIDKNGVTFSAQGLQVRSETTEIQQQQIVYQSPQEWFDQGVMNSNGTSYETGYLRFSGEGAIYTNVEAKFGIDKGWPSAYLGQQGGSLYSQDCYIIPEEVQLNMKNGQDYQNLVMVNRSLSSGIKRGLFATEDLQQNSIKWSISDDGVIWNDSNGSAVSVKAPEATDNWWTVSTSANTTEPANYLTWSSQANIKYPNAIRYFELQLYRYNESADEFTIYASTKIPRYSNNAGLVYNARAQYLVQTGSSSYTMYEAKAKISFGKNGVVGYKLWTSNSTYYARLLCFY